jgi:GT2 family glycosyltransferase
MISYIIPHLGRDHVLAWHLKELENQSFDDFEVIIVLDEKESDSIWRNDKPFELTSTIGKASFPLEVWFSGGRGPAATRNLGAEKATSDILLFVGSDCIPHTDLIARHYYYHTFTPAKIVQGYSPFHADVITEFYEFLEASGLQAAWGNLKNKDGSWRTGISATFCLTTNYSINKQLFKNVGGFNETFESAAWEDVELGYQMSRRSESAVFAPDAMNYHYHRYDLDSFVRRCRMEGYNRLTLCKLHPEMAWSMVNPFEIRTAKELDEYEILRWAKELDLATFQNTEADIQLKQIYFSRMAECCKVWSMKGVLDRIADEHPAMQALIHVHKPEQSIEIISGVAAIDDGRYGYASHCAQWFITEVPDNWAAWAFWGEVELARGNRYDAVELFNKSITINPKAEWPRERIKEII